MAKETGINFFQQAPAQDSFQKKFLESVFHKQNILGSFPLSYPVSSLYSFPAVVTDGMAVIVCPDRYAIYRNVSQLQGAGVQFPEMAVLDGTQMPHEEREILEHINHHRVHLLFTYPERFSSLNFLQMLIHAAVSFVAIEDAQFLLEGFAGSFRYHKLWTGLEQLAKKPPMVILTHPLPPARMWELTKRLKMSSYETLQMDPQLEAVNFRVKPLITENQKFRYLARTLAGTPEKGMTGKVHQPGSVLILTSDQASCERLAWGLSRFGFEPVYAHHAGLSREDRLSIERAFRHQDNMVVVSSHYSTRLLKPPDGTTLRFFYWHLPRSLDELYGQLFRISEPRDGELEGTVLYTKEDYQWALRRFVSKSHDAGDQERGAYERFKKAQVSALKKVRSWVLSNDCRYRSLVAHWQGVEEMNLPDCGYCDWCTGHSHKGFLRSLLKHLAY